MLPESTVEIDLPIVISLDDFAVGMLVIPVNDRRLAELTGDRGITAGEHAWGSRFRLIT
jgi:hypothetical protein